VSTTIRDVARRANVSVQTVSRVLNDRPDVASETRARVQQAIAELNFVPAVAARGLPGGQGSALGVLTYPQFALHHAYTLNIEGCATEAARQGVGLVISLVLNDTPDGARAAVDLLIGHRVSGVVVAQPRFRYTPHFRAALSRLRVPVVTTGNYRDPERRFPAIDLDNREAAFLATEHVLRSGHRQVAIIRGASDMGGGDERFAGSVDAFDAYGLTLAPRHIVEAAWSIESGMTAMRNLLARASDFSAVVCHHDLLAIGAMRVLSQAGRRVPEDVAVVGLEDLPIAPYLTPALTTVRGPGREIGAAAVREVLGIEVPDALEELLPGQLIVRESCGTPRGALTAHEPSIITAIAVQ
jgi:LacI family transcriptional regulator